MRPRHSARVPAAALCAVAVLAAPPPPARAHRAPGRTSPEVLWKAYPLGQARGTAAAGRPAPARPVPVSPSRGQAPARAARAAAVTASGRPSSRRGADGGGTGPLPILLAAAAAAATALLLLRRRPHAAPRLAGARHWRARLAAPVAPLRVAGPVAAMGGGPRWARPPRRPPASGGGSPAAAPASGSLIPPDPSAPWIAEVAWSQEGASARFAVQAHSADARTTTELARSGPLDWPPAGAAAVAGLQQAVEELAAALAAAGWTPQAPGAAWYARRFAWAPVAGADPGSPQAETADEPPAERAPARPAQPAEAGRRAPVPVPDPAVEPDPGPPSPRGPARPSAVAAARDSRSWRERRRWPAGADRLWRCELTWKSGVRRGRFQLIAHEPGAGRHVIAESPWLAEPLLADADPRYEAARSAAHGLAAAAQAAGWRRIAPGPRWYSARFTWPGAGAPPLSLPDDPGASTS